MRLIDGDKLMMHLTDWWYSSFRETETEEAKCIHKVMDEVEKSINSLSAIHSDASIAYYQGKRDGIKECTKDLQRLKKIFGKED